MISLMNFVPSDNDTNFNCNFMKGLYYRFKDNYFIKMLISDPT